MPGLSSLKSLYTQPSLMLQSQQHRKILLKKIPDLSRVSSTLAPHLETFRAAYQTYVSQVSSPDMAASFETACLLFALATYLAPKTVLDFGSGFSSYILRFHQQQHPDCQIYSIDDDAAWLDKTRHFLEQAHLATDHLLSLEAFEKLETPQFDLIFHDIGSMQTRQNTLPLVLQKLADTGVLVLDDMHKAKYRQAARNIVRAHHKKSYNAKHFTYDKYKRFAEIVCS